jgi:hypothetical protein
MTDLSGAAWRTSSYSNIGGNCVEVAATGGIVGVRDTQDRAGAVLAFSPEAWQDFATQTRNAAKG